MGLTAPSAPPGTSNPEVRRGRRADPVPWVAGLFLATFLLQRITVPGLPIPITVLLAVGWVGLAAVFRIVEFNRLRLLLWLAAAGVSGMFVPLQTVVVDNPSVSVNSWGLWMVVWAPMVVQLKRRDERTYLRFTRAVAHIGVGLASLSLVFIGSQLVGIRYSDWVSSVVPSSLLVQDFIVSYPIVYGSQIYKSNGWIALEPSFMSFFLGVALICALLARARVWQVLLIGVGLLTTVAGSGLALLAVFIPVLALQGKLGSLRRYFIPGGVVGVLFASTVFGEAILSRVTEVGSARSSTSLRVTEPYVELWPHFIADPVGIFLGYGPGSSADVVTGSGIYGLLVPNILKVVYDYGMLAGPLLIALMVSAYLRGPSTAFALSLAASIFVIQGTAQPIIICSIIVISLWSPTTTSPDAALDDRESAPPQLRRDGAETTFSRADL